MPTSKREKQFVESVKGKWFVIYDDEKNPIARGIIMDSRLEVEKIDVTCKDNNGARQTVSSTKLKIEGDIIERLPKLPTPPRTTGILSIKPPTFWQRIFRDPPQYDYKPIDFVLPKTDPTKRNS